MIPDKCVNIGLLNDDTLIKTNVSMVVYWMMILWLKEKCVNSGLLNDDTLINEWFIEWWYLIKTKCLLVYWMMIFW